MKIISSISERRKSLQQKYLRWEKMTLYQRFQYQSSSCPDYPFFIDERVHSYREMHGQINRTIWCLHRLGVKKGDIVLVASANRMEYICLTFALAAIGAVKIPVNQNLGIAELEYIVLQSEPGFLFAEHNRMANAIKRRVPSLQVICFEKSERNPEAGYPSGGPEGEILTWERFFDIEKYNDPESVEENPDAVVDIIYTSGSTGNPKGVLLTHDMLLRSAYANCLNRGLETGWRMYVPLPLFHVYGYVEGLLAALLVQGSLVVTRGKYDPEKAIQTMADWEVNDILSVPFIMAGILKSEKLKEIDLPSLYAVYCSASVCPDWIWKAIREKLNVHEITTGYGMTEVCGASVQTCPDDSDQILSEYLGKILDGGCAGKDGSIVSYKVLDTKTSKELPAGCPGELVCKGPVLTRGYLKEPKANEQAFDEDGWFHTGDIGYFTEDGYLKLEGRIKDSYRINGENVSLHFLDQVIAKCPEVAMVETVGVPDQKVGYVGAAFIEPVSDREDVLEQIRSYCHDELASYQIPAWFFFGKSDSWSKTSSGKIQKKQLQKLAEEKIKEFEARKRNKKNRT